MVSGSRIAARHICCRYVVHDGIGECLRMVTAIKAHIDEPDSGPLRDYLQLTKPRIVVLLIFTTVTAMVIAAEGNPLPPLVLAATILGGSLAAGGASALNQYIDRDLDKQM